MTPFLLTDIVIKFKPNSKHQRQSELNGSFSTRELMMAGTSSGKNKSKKGGSGKNSRLSAVAAVQQARHFFNLAPFFLQFS